jgi:hypothetical protein
MTPARLVLGATTTIALLRSTVHLAPTSFGTFFMMGSGSGVKRTPTFMFCVPSRILNLNNRPQLTIRKFVVPAHKAAGIREAIEARGRHASLSAPILA